MDTQNMYFEFTVSEIDNKYMKISEFKDDTLFSSWSVWLLFSNWRLFYTSYVFEECNGWNGVG